MAKRCGLNNAQIEFAKAFAKQEIEEYNGDNYIKKFQETIKEVLPEDEVTQSRLTIVALMPQYLFEAYQDLEVPFSEIDFKLMDGLQKLSEAINEGEDIVVDNINALLQGDLSGFSMGGVSFNVEPPKSDVIKEGLEEDFVDHLALTPLKTVSQSNQTEVVVDDEGKKITIVTNIPDPSEVFYQDLIKSLSEIASQTLFTTFENITFQGHTGFKLRITTFRNLDESYVKEKDEKLGGNALIAIVTDNDGNILYFDEEYRINRKTGKPVYTRLSFVKKAKETGAYYIESKGFRQRSDGTLLPTNPLISPRQLAISEGIKNPTDAQLEQYRKRQQEDLRKLYFLQGKVRGGKDFVVNITNASNGFIEMDYDKPIQTNEINWEQSEVPFDPVVYNSKTYDPVGNRWPGTTYIKIPGMRRYAPLMTNNLSDESINTIMELIFNKDLTLNNRPITNTQRIAILEDMLFMDFKNGVSLEVQANDNELVLFFGPAKARRKVELEGITELVESKVREELENFIKEEGDNAERTARGRYYFPSTKNSVTVATIDNNNVNLKSVSIDDFILNHSYTWLVPNENGAVTYSNAHLSYEFDIEQQEELSDVTKVKGKASEVEVWVPGVSTVDAKNAARKSNPKESGIYSMRPAAGDVFTYKGVTVNAKINFGNPWTANPELLKYFPELILAEGATREERLKNAVANYENWIKKLDFLDVFPERREFIREKIKEGYFDGERIIYFKTGYRSHADVIAEMVTDKTKLDAGLKTSEEKKNQVIKAIDELSDDEAVIMTDKISVEARDFDQKEKSEMKPNGLWFGLGNSWSDWVQVENPKMVRENAFVLEFDKSKMLIISTAEELDAFTEKYSTDDGFTINWNEVAKEYGGIQIAPYIEERRENDKTLWYYTWDVASGAIWDKSVITNYTEISEYLKSKKATTEPTSEPTKKEDEIDDTDDLELPPDLFTSAKKDIRTKLKRIGKSKKLEAARKWYIDSGLNDLVPFEVAWGIFNSDAYATFTRYGVTLWAGSDYSDLYHEGWHVFTSFILTPEEQKELYDEFTSLEGTFTNYQGVVKRFADATELDAEEFYAREFREYALEFGKFDEFDEIIGEKVLGKRIVKNKIFRRIYQFLTWLFSGFKRIPSAERKSLIETMDAMELFHNKQLGVKKMYDRLRTLDLKNEIAIDIASVKLRKGFDRLNSNRIDGLNENTEDEFSLQETSVINNSMEAWFSEFITGIAEATDKEGKKRLDPSLSIVAKYFSDPGKYLKYFYDSYLPNKLAKLKVQYAKAGDTESLNLINKILRNYTDYESSRKGNTDDLFNGVIRFHYDNSIFIKDIDRKILDRATYVEDYDSLVTFDKSGFEISVQDLADLEVSWLIASLHKYDGTEPVRNMLGVHELNDFSRTFATLISKLTGIEDRVEMEAELKKLESDYPMFGELLLKMGNSRSLDPSTWTLWTSFKLAFYLMNVPVFQLNLVETYERGGLATFTVTYGRSSASYRVVEMDFRSGFATSTPEDNKYIESTPEGNILNIAKILEDFPKNSINTLSRKRAFLKAIGLPLTNNKEINKELNADRIKFEFIRGKLQAMLQTNRDVTDIINDLKTSFELRPNSGVFSPSEATNLSTILEIEHKYSGKYKSGSVTTAVGTRTYEQGQHSSLSVQIDSINKATSFDQMMKEMPWMRHLDPLKNPDTRRSIWLNSIFEMDNFEKGRPKRKGAALFLRNLSGIQSIVNDRADYNFSTSAADSVRYDKMILDIYALLLGGAPATMTHSDKGMVYSMGVNKVQVQGLPSQQNSSLYVDTSDFFNLYGEDADSDGYTRAYSIFINQLKSELEIMKLVRNGEAGVNVPGYTVEDSKGEIRGANYQLFQDILKDPLKKKLIDQYMKNDDVDEVINDNLEDIEGDLKEYFDKHILDTYNYIEELLFVSKELEANIVKELRNKKISQKDISEITKNPEKMKKAIISSYFINYEIHNIESIRLVYGNVAQYNMAKEEKHKRNANAASTGRAFSLDQTSIDYINSLSRRYRLTIAETSGASWKKRIFDGTFNSVVFEDYKFEISLYYTLYFDALVDDFMSNRNLTKKEAEKKAKVVLAPYENMEVGDGQGWITFDAYRIARKLTSRWGPAQEKMYNDIIDGKIDNLAEIASFFPPLKYLMNGPLQAEGIPVIGQHKFSLMPLIPNILGDKNFEQLHIELEKNDADYALFKSGSKVATITDESGKANELYNITKLKDGREILEVIQDSKYVINTVYLQYMKDVLDVSMKYKGSSIFSTQMRKLIEQGFILNGVPVDFEIGNEDRVKNWNRLKLQGEQALFDASPVYKKYKIYEDLISDLIRVRKEDLLKEAGWTQAELESGTGNIESLISMIKSQLSIIEDLSENELDFIGVNLQGQLKNDLSYSLVSDKIESMLISIANKSLIKQLVNGEPLVQVSSALSEWRSATDQELNKYGNDLETYRRVKLKDGTWSETYEMEVKVSLQGNFKKLFNLTHTDGKKVAVRNKQGEIDQEESLNRLNELINNKKWRSKKENKKLITMVGVRIPVQGANSMEMMIIREFLPEKTGNIIIPPKEIVAKSGSDFDIDKLTIMMPGIVNTLKGPKIISSKIKTRKESTLRAKKTEFENELKEIRAKYRDIRSRKDVSKEYKWSAEKQSRYIEILQQISALEQKWDELNNEKNFYTNKLIEISKWDVKNDGVVDTRSRGKYHRVYNLYLEAEAAFLNVSSDLADLEAYKMEFIKESKQEIKDSIDAKQEEEMDKVKQKLDKVKIELYAKSSEAIENDILFAVKDLLADPINFVNLVTPNSTEQFTEIQKGEEKSHLERLREKSAYSPKRGTRGMLDKVSHTRIIEPIYNIEKHAQNSVGKQTLGIGAVDNTFNALLTRAGAYLNKNYVHWEDTRRVAILMDHNVMPDTDNQVSLSDLYDYDRANLISDTISQLINGWVDVAKEAWIFDINGNKVLSPVLLLLVQAGVPIKQALNFIANPYVKDYVEEVYKSSSIFSRTNEQLGPIVYNRTRAEEDYENKYIDIREGVDPRQIKRVARSRMFYKMGLEGFANEFTPGPIKMISFNEIYKHVLSGYDVKFSEEDLDQMLDQKVTPMSGTSINAIRKNKAAMAFLHYLELDDIASNFTNLKGTLNFDTKKSTSLIDYAIRQATVDDFIESAKNIVSSPVRTNNKSNVIIEIKGNSDLTNMAVWEKNIKDSDFTFFIKSGTRSAATMMPIIEKIRTIKGAKSMHLSRNKGIDANKIVEELRGLNLGRPIRINVIGDNIKRLPDSSNFLDEMEEIKKFSKKFVEAIKDEEKERISIDYVLSSGETGFEQFINIEAAEQNVNSKIFTNYSFMFMNKSNKAVPVKKESDFRLRFKNFTTNYQYDTALTANIFPMRVIASIIEDSPIADFDISKFQLSMWSKMFELKSNEVLNKELIEWVKDPDKKMHMKQLYGEPEVYLQKFRNSIVAAALIDSIKGVKYSEVSSYKSITATAASVESMDIPGKGIVIYRDENQNLKMLLDREYIKAQYISKSFVNKSIGLTVDTFKSVDEYFHFVMEKELIRAQLPASKMKGLTLFRKLYAQNKTEKGKDKKAAQVAYEQVITNMALYNTLNFYTLFKNPNFSYAKEIMRIKEEHPNLSRLDVVNNLNINASFKGPKTKVKNLKFADARFTKDEVDTYFENMEVLINQRHLKKEIFGDGKVSDNEIEYISTLFKVMPLFSILQSGFNSKDILSINRPMPSDSITYLFDKYKEDVKSKISDRTYITLFKDAFDNHSANRKIRNRFIPSLNLVTSAAPLIPTDYLGSISETTKAYKGSVEDFVNYAKANPSVKFVIEHATTPNGNLRFGKAIPSMPRTDNVYVLDPKSINPKPTPVKRYISDNILDEIEPTEEFVIFDMEYGTQLEEKDSDVRNQKLRDNFDYVYVRDVPGAPLTNEMLDKLTRERNFEVEALNVTIMDEIDQVLESIVNSCKT